MLANSTFDEQLNPQLQFQQTSPTHTSPQVVYLKLAMRWQIKWGAA